MMVVYLVTYYSEAKQVLHAVEAHNTCTPADPWSNCQHVHEEEGGKSYWSLYCLNHSWHMYVHGFTVAPPVWSCDRDCLRGSIVNTDDPEVRCPFAEYQCNSIITEREIRGVSKQTQPSTCRTTTAVHENTPPPSQPLTQCSLY